MISRVQGADTLKSDRSVASCCCIVLLRHAVASPHWVCMGAVVASFDHSGSGWGKGNADPMQRRDGRRHWMPRRLE